MALAFDGTGYLTHPAKILSALPCTIIAFGSRADSLGGQAWVSHSQSDGDRGVLMYLVGSSDEKFGQHRSPATSGQTQKTLAPHVNNTALQMFAFEVTSAASRTVRFGDSANPATNTVASDTPVDDVTNHNQVLIGAQQWNSGAVDMFAKGSLAEVHFIAGVVTTEDYDAMLVGTIKPEQLPGWVDGWTLKDYNADGTYTSIGGSRTMTASGGVTASALPHPIARAGAAINLVGSNSTQSAISSSGAVVVTTTPPGTITSSLMKSFFTKLLRPNETNITIFVYEETGDTGDKVVKLTGQSSNASGIWSGTNGLFVIGRDYLLRYKLADGSWGAEVVTAT